MDMPGTMHVCMCTRGFQGRLTDNHVSCDSGKVLVAKPLVAKLLQDLTKLAQLSSS